MKTPISPKDIRKGDLIRWEDGESAHEYRAGVHCSPTFRGHHFLLDRPKRLLWPAGTDLWLTEDLYPWAKGDRITLARDWREGDWGVTKEGSPLRLIVVESVVTDVEPAPPVELPTEPTLGWLDVSDIDGSIDSGPGRVLSVFRNRGGLCDGGQAGSWSHDFVTAFTPATAVPADALDVLRDLPVSFLCDGHPETLYVIDRISEFVRAIDKANGPTS